MGPIDYWYYRIPYFEYYNATRAAKKIYDKESKAIWATTDGKKYKDLLKVYSKDRTNTEVKA